MGFLSDLLGNGGGFEQEYHECLEDLERKKIEDDVKDFHRRMTVFMRKYIDIGVSEQFSVNEKNFNLFWPPVYKKLKRIDIVDYYGLTSLLLAKNSFSNKSDLKKYSNSEYSKYLFRNIQLGEGKVEEKMMATNPSYNTKGESITIRAMPKKVRQSFESVLKRTFLKPLVHVEPREISKKEFKSEMLHEETHYYHSELLKSLGVEKPINNCKDSIRIFDEAAASAVSKVYNEKFKFKPEAYSNLKTEHLRYLYSQWIQYKDEEMEESQAIQQIRKESGEKIKEIIRNDHGA